MEYQRINPKYLHQCKCYYCGIKNPPDDSGPFPLNYIEKTQEGRYICDRCIELHESNTSDQINLYERYRKQKSLFPF